MSPKMIMNVLALKLYIGYNRFESYVLKITKINKGNSQLHYRYTDRVINMNKEWQSTIQT